MIISERVFQLLEEKGISQIEFSRATGIAQSTISDWKRKKSNPASDKIMVICEVLEISPVELLSGAEGASLNQMDYVRIDKDSEEFQMLDAVRNLSTKNRARLLGYLDALKGE